MYEWQCCVLWEASDVDSSLVILILDVNSHNDKKNTILPRECQDMWQYRR